MPPGSAKSTYASVLFPAWWFTQFPRGNIIAASHTDELAQRFGRKVRNTASDHALRLGYGLSADSKAVGRWETNHGGEYFAAGVGGAIAGRRADLVLIDDPVRNRESADSETVRESQWNWFTSDLRTRMKPSAAIVVIMTRWHADDLGGRLLDRQPGLWRVLKLPAKAGDADPIGRAPGEYLWGDDAYGYGAELRLVHREYEAAGAMRDWSALYQQDPRPAEGALFHTAKIDILPAAPLGRNVVRAWDLAATKQVGTRDPDWTVGIKLLREDSGRYVVLDAMRLRGGPDEVEAAIVNTAKQDGASVRIGLPQDPGQAGKTQALYLTRALAGYRVETGTETGDKATRAGPFAAQVNVGNVAMLAATWNRPLLDEMAGFPAAAHDDHVDALSRAFGMVGLSAPPMRINPSAIAAFGRR
jgi:predicted phage terminase large subunit-like protein